MSDTGPIARSGGVLPRGRAASYRASPRGAAPPPAGRSDRARPHGHVTNAITIEAPPGRVWPWLAQLGAGRGGWYSFDPLRV